MQTTRKPNLYLVPRTAPTVPLKPARIGETELDWYFTMSESDLGVRSNYLDMLVPTRHRDPHEDSAERRASAARARRTILGWLRRIEDAGGHHAGVLQVAYSVRPWPEPLTDRLGRLTGVVVRLASAEVGLPDDDAELDALERATAERLVVALARLGPPAVEPLRKQASARYAEAFGAYERARGGGPSVLAGWA